MGGIVACCKDFTPYQNQKDIYRQNPRRLRPDPTRDVLRVRKQNPQFLITLSGCSYEMCTDEIKFLSDRGSLAEIQDSHLLEYKSSQFKN